LSTRGSTSSSSTTAFSLARFPLLWDNDVLDLERAYRDWPTVDRQKVDL